MQKQALISVEKLNYLVLSLIPIFFIILGFIVNTPKEIFQGLYKIILCQDVLLVDYFAIGGMGLPW